MPELRRKAHVWFAFFSAALMAQLYSNDHAIHLAQFRPISLIEQLKATTGWIPVKESGPWVTAEDLRALIPLLDSTEPCAAVALEASSRFDASGSTVGHEAAFMILGFRDGKYPPRHHSLQSGDHRQEAWRFLNAMFRDYRKSIKVAAAHPRIYIGEPFAEALADLVASGAIAISHELVQASPEERGDAFKLRDGQILILTSSAGKVGQAYTVTSISVASPGDQLEFEALPSLLLPPHSDAEP